MFWKSILFRPRKFRKYLWCIFISFIVFEGLFLLLRVPCLKRDDIAYRRIDKDKKLWIIMDNHYCHDAESIPANWNVHARIKGR